MKSILVCLAFFISYAAGVYIAPGILRGKNIGIETVCLADPATLSDCPPATTTTSTTSTTTTTTTTSTTTTTAAAPVRKRRNNFGRLSCGDHEVIKIVRAVIGLFDPKLCPSSMSLFQQTPKSDTCDECLQTTQILSEKCNNKNECDIDLVKDGYPNRCKCVPNQYLRVQYECIGSRLNFRPFSNGGMKNQ